MGDTEVKAGARALLVLLLAAVAVRIAFAVVFLRHPVGAIVALDTEPYRALAAAIAAGRFDDPGFDYLNPPYAFLLAPFAWLSADTARVFVTAVQILLDALVVALTYYVAARLFSAPVALGAAGLYALYGTAVFYTAIVLPVTTSVASLILALAALLFVRGRAPAFWVLPGLALGVFLLARPNGLVLLPVVAFWMRRTSAKEALGLLAGLTVALAPFGLRSMPRGTGPSPFPVNGGINFYIGNGPEAHGRYTHVPNVTDKPGDQVRTSIAEASRRAGRPLDARAASRFWFREGLAWMAREPAAALRLTAQKAGTFFRAEEPSLNISYDFARRHVGLLRACLGLGLILPLALWGTVAVLRAPHRRRHPDVRLVLGALWAYAASVIVFFISDRYRMPAVPLLAIFAAHGASALVADLRGRGVARPLLAAGFLAAAALFVNTPFPFFRYAKDGIDHVKLSDVYVGRGEHDKAIEECGKAAELSPERPDTFFCFASAYYYMKDYFRAEMSLRGAIAAQAGTFSDLPARRNLAHVLKEQQLFEAALNETADEDQRQAIRAEYEDWKRRIPDPAAYARAQLEEARRQQGEGRLFEARYAAQRAVQADPTHHEAYFAWATIARDLQLRPEACHAARRAVEGRPQEARYEEAARTLCR